MTKTVAQYIADLQDTNAETRIVYQWEDGGSVARIQEYGHGHTHLTGRVYFDEKEGVLYYQLVKLKIAQGVDDA